MTALMQAVCRTSKRPAVPQSKFYSSGHPNANPSPRAAVVGLAIFPFPTPLGEAFAWRAPMWLRVPVWCASKRGVPGPERRTFAASPWC